ncbi:MAG: hypothetical protein IT582_00355 [Opitutaceae bacterium]|nr:hypothetical protein [Opitutaceae bacterium]
MKGWLTDAGKMVWALFYWNTRKTVFRARGGRGLAPCQHPSDSGEAMKTGCDACAHWHRRERFRRVCPLLQSDGQGGWVCGANREDVRPFWDRFAAYFGGAALGMILLLAVLFYSAMRGIGYQVTWRQVLWPPAWSELRAVRADLFIKQAREKYAAGGVREAIQALVVAHQLNPAHFQVTMLLAQFYQAGSPQQSDQLYRQLMDSHPERREEIAQAWFQGLLARGRMDAIAELAKMRLLDNPAQPAVWTYALRFAARHQPGVVDLAALGRDSAVPAPARAVLALAGRVQDLPAAEARRVLLDTLPVADFPFDRVYRVDALTRLGYPQDALNLLAAGRRELSGRDVARLIFAAYAQMGDRARLKAEFAALLSPERRPGAGEFTLLAVHVVDFPNAELAAMLVAALPRLPTVPADAWLQAAVAVFCAAGSVGDEAGMVEVKRIIQASYDIKLTSLDGLRFYFLKQSGISRIESILPSINPLSLELNYALLDRYLNKR